MNYDIKQILQRAGVRRRTITLRPIDPSRAFEREYRKLSVGLVREARAYVNREIVPKFAEIHLTKDDAASDMRFMFEAFRVFMRGLTLTSVAMVGRIFEAEAERHTRKFAQSVRTAIGIDMTAMLLSSTGLNERVAIAAQRNAQLITGFAEDIQNRIAEVVSRNLARGGTRKVLQAELTKTFGIEDRRAQLIARNEAASLTSNLNQFRQEEAGVTEYIWRSSQDERVRPLHDDLDGTKHKWSEPGPDDGMHPGEPINCRCTAQAVIELEPTNG